MSITRRSILGGGAGAALISEAIAAENLSAPQGTRIARLQELTVGQAVAFSYPDPQSPAFLLKLGRPVADGIGPERDIVAFSALCTHLGCSVMHKDGRFLCPCHGSQFDPETGGRCYQGPATTALPKIRLALDGDGSIHATGLDGVVWGRVDSASMGAL